MYMEHDCYSESIPYVEIVQVNVSNDATFRNFNEQLEKLSIRLKSQTDKEQIFNLHKDCVYFGEEENKQVDNYIKNNSVKEKNNIFDYYD